MMTDYTYHTTRLVLLHVLLLLWQKFLLNGICLIPASQKTIEDFLETESLHDLFTPEQFISIMAGNAHINDTLCELLSYVLPFRITSERITLIKHSVAT